VSTSLSAFASDGVRHGPGFEQLPELTVIYHETFTVASTKHSADAAPKPSDYPRVVNKKLYDILRKYSMSCRSQGRPSNSVGHEAQLCLKTLPSFLNQELVQFDVHVCIHPCWETPGTSRWRQLRLQIPR